MATNKKIVYCGALKRILAFVFDFCFAILITFILNTVAITPLLSNVLNNDEITLQYKERLVESGLYIQTENGIVAIDLTYDETIQSEEEFVQYLDAQLTKFHSNEDFKCSNLQYYIDYKLNENTLFELDELTNNVVVKDTASIDELKKFYVNAVNDAINSVLINDEIISFTSTQIILNTIYCFILSLIIAMILFFLLIPILNKKNFTLGKFVFKIGVVSTKNFKYINKKQTLIRFSILFLEVLLSLFTFGAVMLISFAFTIFTKNDSALHDLAAQTSLVDLRYYNPSLIDEEEGELSCH